MQSASGKIKALNRIRPYLDIETARKLVSAHVLSNFNYCPLIWMNANKTCYDLINKTHKRALRAVYKDFNSSLDVLLLKDNSEHVHIRNIKNLMIEVFKTLNDNNPSFMKEIFIKKHIKFNLRCGDVLLKIPETKTKKYGVQTARFQGSLPWNTLPTKIKYSKSLQEFRKSIKGWNDISCSCCS